MKGLGSNFPGFFAEYVTVREDLVFSVEGIDPDTAVFTEPAACAMHGLETLAGPARPTALVFGAGPTGLLLAQLIRTGGAASVTVAAPTQFKLDTAEALGVDRTVLIDRDDMEGNRAKLLEASGADGYDYVVEATGSTRSATSAYRSPATAAPSWSTGSPEPTRPSASTRSTCSAARSPSRARSPR